MHPNYWHNNDNDNDNDDDDDDNDDDNKPYNGNDDEVNNELCQYGIEYECICKSGNCCSVNLSVKFTSWLEIKGRERKTSGCAAPTCNKRAAAGVVCKFLGQSRLRY
ncbi:hypothetical protein T05_7637 [Trichinella murrelli]|uniref:Uncharacterized protein n=1 Tax=Trichinella murrelli TaxID=144512 RepID=A0A0V0TJA0_9BILA|nr:hypothetical protein T05_15826 [Trichinella murrelli]KRX39093.1 hypothetical protein T05_7637 [Trichinella murrelli]